MVAIIAVLGFLALILLIAVDRLVELISTYTEEIDSFKEGATIFLTGLDLAPFMVIMSVTFWSAILGPLGASLGVPVTVSFKELVLEADDRNSWIARFMGKGGHKPPAGDTPEGEPQAAAGNE